MKNFQLLISVLVTVLFLSCAETNQDTLEQEMLDYGKILTDDPSLGMTGNGLSCINCHEPPEPERKINNHQYVSIPLNSLAYRTAYWDSTRFTFLSAVNECITRFMNGDPLTESSKKWNALSTYLNHVASSNNRPTRRWSYQLFENVNGIDTLAYRLYYLPSDSTLRSMTAFQSYCGYCHLNGINHAPELRYRRDIQAEYIAIKARLSGSEYLFGRMPFFLTNVLPDDSLRSIIAFLLTE